MEVQSTSTTLVLERRPIRSERTERPVPVRVRRPGHRRRGRDRRSRRPAAGASDSCCGRRVWSLLATIFLIEGYRWLGVVHFGAAAAGSWLFGTAGVAAVALVAPLAALLLTSGRPSSGWSASEDLVVVVAVVAAVATATALIVGGSAWGKVAGVGDIVLAATALGAVIAR